MKRFLPFLLALVAFVPLTAHAQSAFGFGPIVPEICRTCACGFGGVLAIIQNLTNFIIAISIIIATIIIAWGGMLYILSPTNPESRSTANKMLINAVIGIMIVLSAWLIVDFVMKTLYGGQFGPWNSILINQNEGGQSCVVAKPTTPLFSGNIVAVPGQGTGAGSEPAADADGTFTYDPGIFEQRGDASPALATLMNCMAKRLPPKVGRVSSISDSKIVSKDKTFGQCAASRVCNHSANSCHYGGSKCTGKSYAVDFGDEENMAVLKGAAAACGATVAINEGDHLHVSVGAAHSCGCDQ